ncbi:MAG: hypothetical protein RLZZ01_1377, partial [Actinomycetota bacterium]
MKNREDCGLADSWTSMKKSMGTMSGRSQADHQRERCSKVSVGKVAAGKVSVRKVSAVLVPAALVIVATTGCVSEEVGSGPVVDTTSIS